jgi:hypothetical protein
MVWLFKPDKKIKRCSELGITALGPSTTKNRKNDKLRCSTPVHDKEKPKANHV